MVLRHPALGLALVAACTLTLAGCGQKATNASKPAEAASAFPVYDAHGKTGIDAGKDFLDREIGRASCRERV